MDQSRANEQSAGTLDEGSGPDAQRSLRTASTLRTDGGDESDAKRANEDSTESDPEGAAEDGATAGDRSNVEVTEAGESKPVDPKWQKPDIEDIPEVDGPKTRPADSTNAGAEAAVDRSPKPGHAEASGAPQGESSEESTAGMPNTARTPGQSRLKEGGADGFVVAIELCARLPDEVRLPGEAADLVPVALEAELEQDVQSFAADEFDNPTPHVETLDFVEADDELWLRLRLGVSPESFDDLDPDAIRDHALQQVDGLL